VLSAVYDLAPAEIATAVQMLRKARHLPFGTFDRELGKLEGTQKL
jgi:hypothetical protein